MPYCVLLAGHEHSSYIYFVVWVCHLFESNRWQTHYVQEPNRIWCSYFKTNIDALVTSLKVSLSAPDVEVFLCAKLRHDGCFSYSHFSLQEPAVAARRLCFPSARPFHAASSGRRGWAVQRMPWMDESLSEWGGTRRLSGKRYGRYTSVRFENLGALLITQREWDCASVETTVTTVWCL